MIWLRLEFGAFDTALHVEERLIFGAFDTALHVEESVVNIAVISNVILTCCCYIKCDFDKEQFLSSSSRRLSWMKLSLLGRGSVDYYCPQWAVCRYIILLLGYLKVPAVQYSTIVHSVKGGLGNTYLDLWEKVFLYMWTDYMTVSPGTTVACLV